jgi:UDP-N-acetylglucosamine/UDP-N-acetylgalactosamine 4-epimerase
VLGSVSEAIGTWIDPVRTPRRPGDVRSTHADITEASELLGWAPKADWKDAVAKTVAWFRNGRG